MTDTHAMGVSGVKTGKIARIFTVAALAMWCAVMTAAPVGAAGAGETKRQVWTAREAEIARKFSAGMPLKNIINEAVRAGASVDDVVAAAIKADLEPFDVVYTAVSEKHPVSRVVRAALEAGAPLNTVVNAATRAGAVGKTIYSGAVEAGESPSDVERAMAAVSTPGASPNGLSASPAKVSPVLDAPLPVAFGWGGILSIPVPPRGGGNLHLGPLQVNPFVSVTETFSDNVFYRFEEPRRDSITTVVPGIGFRLPFATHSAAIEYFPVMSRYEKYRDENINDHHAAGVVDLQPWDVFGLSISDTFTRGHVPRSSSFTGTVEVFHTNAADAAITIRPTEHFTLRIDYEKSDWRFITGHFRDREEDRITGAAFYQVFTGTSLLLEYSHKNVGYDQTALELDSRIETAQAGFTWDLYGRSRGTIKAGLSRKLLTSSDGAKFTVKVGSADLRHDITNSTTIVLAGQRSLNEPSIPGINYFISTGGYAELTQRFGRGFSAALRGSYVHDFYPEVRTDQTNLGGAGLKYRSWEWLEFGVGYQLLSRHSSIEDKAYREHSTGITAEMSF